MICNRNSNDDVKEKEKQKIATDPVIPYFQSLQDVKIKCESYVEYLPPELFSYIFDSHGQLSIVQVTTDLNHLLKWFEKSVFWL